MPPWWSVTSLARLRYAGVGIGAQSLGDSQVGRIAGGP